MEHYDELERMKARRKRAQVQKTSGQKRKSQRPSSRNDDAFDIIDLENFDYTSLHTGSPSSKNKTGKGKKRPGQEKKKKKRQGFVLAKVLVLAVLIFSGFVLCKR